MPAAEIIAFLSMVSLLAARGRTTLVTGWDTDVARPRATLSHVLAGRTAIIVRGRCAG
jgi:hypothetical protein